MKEETLTEDEVVAMVFFYSQASPGFLNRVIQSGIQGIQSLADRERQRAADMETIASVAFGIVSDGKKVTKKTKEYFEKLALAKLEKYDFKTSCNWSWAIDKNDN